MHGAPTAKYGNTHHTSGHGAINLVIHFDIFTLFPGMFDGLFADSILKRAQEAGVLSVALHNIRDYAEGRHRVTDDTPYGGGGGMVMKPEPIFRAVEMVLNQEPGWRFESIVRMSRPISHPPHRSRSCRRTCRSSCSHPRVAPSTRRWLRSWPDTSASP